MRFVRKLILMHQLKHLNIKSMQPCRVTHLFTQSLFWLVVFLWSNSSTADSSALDEGISFAASNTIAPYFYPQQPGGIQYELLNAALTRQNMFIKRVTLAPNRRALRLVLSEAEDCLVNAPENIPQLHYTQSLNEYQNSVFTLTDSRLLLNEVEDLETISLLAFQNASKFLGARFSQMVKNNPNYNEIDNQQSQIFMLFTGRVQAIVLERRIFEFYRQMLATRVDTSKSVTEFALFKKAPRKVACRNKRIVQRLDAAIADLRNTPQYQKILSLH
ncbi:transporter substrate-binding domain-containing protein [Shewanella gelidii]|uniref:transporter substrate-binding domain-containing protein n=1 Tax=Shewanella gelidii TaxID=1642821 RepID=UPI00166AF4D8|nr:transporter substrate-binding domain-containing protein [Shewanella gelidii]MCL1097809.1 amino acid ABC transporter [Shewanella gelidii]